MVTLPIMHDLPSAFTDSLRAQGLNLFGILGGDTYDALCAPPFQRATLHPGAQSAIVVGSGGGALWAAIGCSPEAGRRHRINEFTQRIIRATVTEHLNGSFGESRCLWPNDVRDNAFLPLMSLAIASGLGVPSRLMLLINPVYGLWIGLRGVILTPAPFAPTMPLSAEGFAPCTACHAPCAVVCHGRVITDSAYDGTKCLQARIMKRACRRTCDARLACPVGSGHQYPVEQMAHHSRHLLNWKTLSRYAFFIAKRRVSG